MAGISGGSDLLSRSELNEVWTYECTVTSETNPLYIDIHSNFNPIKVAEANFKIYIDNVLVVNETRSVSPNPNSGVPRWIGASYWAY